MGRGGHSRFDPRSAGHVVIHPWPGGTSVDVRRHDPHRCCAGQPFHHPGALPMSTSTPVTALMLAAAVVLAIGFVAGSLALFVLSIAAFFGAGLLTVLDGRRA